MTPAAKNQSAAEHNWRRSLVALLFFATTINYLDRIVLAVLIPLIRKDLGFSDREYGLITGAFQLAYTIGFLVAGDGAAEDLFYIQRLFIGEVVE